MNFPDEYYIRVFVRDTIGWLMMTWQARCTLLCLLRKVDRAGVLDLAEWSDEDMAAAVAVVIGLPVDVVRPGLENLIERQTLTVQGQFLIVPRFIEAQECIQSDRLRKAEQRRRYRDRVLAEQRGLVRTNGHVSFQPVTNGDATSQDVTQRDAASRIRPKCHSSRAEHSLAEQKQTADTAAAASAFNPTPSPTSADTPAADILAELQRHPSLAAVATLPVAEALASRFGTSQITKGTRLEWVLEAIRECAADSAIGGLTAEALGKKVRSYCDHARPPRREVNGTGRYSHSDAVIESKEVTPELEAEMRKVAESRKRQQEERKALLERTQKK